MGFTRRFPGAALTAHKRPAKRRARRDGVKRSLSPPTNASVPTNVKGYKPRKRAGRKHPEKWAAAGAGRQTGGCLKAIFDCGSRSPSFRMKREPGREQGAPGTRRRPAGCLPSGRAAAAGRRAPRAPTRLARSPPHPAPHSPRCRRRPRRRRGCPSASTRRAARPARVGAPDAPTPAQAGLTPTHGDVSAPGGVASPPRRPPASLLSEGGSRRAFRCGQWVSPRHAVWAPCPAAGAAISTSRFERLGPFLLALSLTSCRGDVTHREPERLNPGNPAGTPPRGRPCALSPRHRAVM